MALIYLVEDDDGIGEIESFALKNAGHEVALLTSVSAFWKACKKKIPDLIVMDVMLPDADGFHIVKEIREKELYAKIPILMVSARDSELDIVRGLDCGADDYLTKPFGVMEFVSRIRALLRRFSSKKKQISVIGNRQKIELNKDAREVFVKGEKCPLTYKEFELLQVLMSHADQVMTRDSLMELIWGVDFFGESRTLDMHIRTLRKNLVKPAARYKRYEMSDIVSEKRRMKQNEKKDAVKLYGNCYDIDDCRVVINNGCVL